MYAIRSYYVHEFDLTGQNLKQAEVFISATDIAGNVTTLSRKIPVDRNADLPTVSIDTPAQDDSFAASVWLSGLARDDDGIAAVRVSVDKGEARITSYNVCYTKLLRKLADHEPSPEQLARSLDCIRNFPKP